MELSRWLARALPPVALAEAGLLMTRALTATVTRAALASLTATAALADAAGALSVHVYIAAGPPLAPPGPGPAGAGPETMDPTEDDAEFYAIIAGSGLR